MVLDSGFQLDAGDLSDTKVDGGTPGFAHRKIRTHEATDQFGGQGVSEFSIYDSAVALDPVNPTELTGPQPDLVVITHGEFRAGLDRWASPALRGQLREPGRRSVRLQPG